MSFKTPITVTVSGPGGCINAEIELIRRMFVDNGFEVEVNNTHPPQGETIAEHVERIFALEIPHRTKITIVGKHCPWGG